jgi:hypothetical protein
MLAEGSSRRGVLKAVGGFLLGGLLLGLPGKAQADRDKGDDNGKDDGKDDGGDNGKDDGKDDDGDPAINKACKKYCSTCQHVRHHAHGKCIERCKRTLRKNPKAKLCGHCTAATTFTACSGSGSCCTPKTGNYCANLQTDVNNCGSCGTVCTGTGCPPTTPACCAGSCCASGTCCGVDADCPSSNPTCSGGNGTAGSNTGCCM